MKVISPKQVLQVHTYLIERFGGLPGVRDEGLLDSAIAAPFQTFDQIPLYSDAVTRAAKLAHSLISNHPFNDGNKRTGVAVMGIYLELEGITLTASNEELIVLGLKIATGTDLDYVNTWLQTHTTKPSSIHHAC